MQANSVPHSVADQKNVLPVNVNLISEGSTNPIKYSVFQTLLLQDDGQFYRFGFGVR